MRVNGHVSELKKNLTCKSKCSRYIYFFNKINN